MSITIEEKNTLKEIFRDVIYEVLREERINFYKEIIPAVSDEEMKEIESLYRSPKDYKKEDFVDMTDWVNQ